MTAGFRLTMTALPLALAALLSAAPLHAQNNTQAAQNVTQPAPVSNDTIGPSELRDFSLGNPATRSAPTIAPRPPSTTLPQTNPRQPSATPSGQLPPANRPAPSGQPGTASAPATVQPQPQPRPQAAAPSAAPDPSSSVTFDLPSSDSPAAAPDVDSATSSTLGSQPGLVPVTPPESASIPLNSGPPMWPWLLAALLAGVGALYYGKRQRLRRATAGDAMPFDSPQPAPEPLERAAPPAPRPARPVAAPPQEPPISSRIPGMIVSTRLRPQLDIQFIPERLIVDPERTIVRFAAMLLNSGNAPALDILVEAAMFNAGPSQDDEIGAFFAHPRGLGDRVPQLLPLNNMTFRSEVVLPTSGLRLFEIEGRKLFVPLVAFNALYRWGGKDAQTSESFVVGIDTQSEKMGPFRIDSAPRQFRNVAARSHSVRLRK
jgi:hypothetical protein